MEPLIRRAMLLAAALVLVHFRAEPGLGAAAVETVQAAAETRPVATVSYNGQEFLSSFNSSRDEARLVLVFSPT